MENEGELQGHTALCPMVREDFSRRWHLSWNPNDKELATCVSMRRAFKAWGQWRERRTVQMKHGEWGEWQEMKLGSLDHGALEATVRV